VLRIIPFLALAACVATPKITGYRAPDAPIYSNAVLAPADLAGQWTQVADFAASVDCGAGAVQIAPAPGGVVMQGQLCLGGQVTDVSGLYPAIGPGRIQRGSDAPWWVIWADTNLRTLAIGTPDGRFGVILNKGADLPQDRLTAAREIFDFNGYNTARLRLF
jgi:apolipoprotein D and lipocalin family protein